MSLEIFEKREISWLFDQVSRYYPDSPSKFWRQRTDLEEPPEVRVEEENYRARIKNGFDLLGKFFIDIWTIPQQKDK